MELLTRLVAAKDCYVALPQHVVQVLAQGDFPPVPLFLEVQRYSGYDLKQAEPSGADAQKQVWHLAWMGAVARGPEFEVPEALGRCVGLPAGIQVRVRVQNAQEVPPATVVSVEPVTPDDWEMLELNQGHLEETILSQVALVRCGEAFPVWVRRQACITLRVVHSSPQPLVRLSPGAELVVAPMERSTPPAAAQGRRMQGASADSGGEAAESLPSGGTMGSKKAQRGTRSSLPEQEGARGAAEDGAASGEGPVWLRVQELHPSLAPALSSRGGLRAWAPPSCCVYVAAATAERAGLGEHQLASVAALGDPSPEARPLQRATGSRGAAMEKAGPGGQGLAGSSQEEGEGQEGGARADQRPLLLQLRLWEGVAPGHVMMAPVLRLRVGTHLQGCVRLQGVRHQPGVPPALLYISPLQFRDAQSGSEPGTGGRSGREGKGLVWPTHRQLLASAGSYGDAAVPLVPLGNGQGAREDASKNGTAGTAALLDSWLQAQASCRGSGADRAACAPVVDKTVLHFQVARRATQEGAAGEQSGPKDTGSRGAGGAAGHRPKDADAFFMLSFGVPHAGERLHGGRGGEEQQTVGERAPPDSPTYVQIQQLREAVAAGRVEVRLAGAVAGRLSGSAEKDSFWARPAPRAAPRWLQPVVQAAGARLRSVLGRAARQERARLGTPAPGGVLLCGAEASGKSQVAQALAEELRRDERCLAYPVVVRCAELEGEPEREVRAGLRRALEEGCRHAPALVILDDLDALLPAAGEADGAPGGGGGRSRVEFVADLLDTPQRGERAPAVAFLGVARSTAALPQELQLSGRLDLSVDLPAPADAERSSILAQALAERHLACSDALVAAVAGRCQGCDAADMEVLVERAVHVAAGRFLLQAQQGRRSRERDGGRKAKRGGVPAGLGRGGQERRDPAAGPEAAGEGGRRGSRSAAAPCMLELQEGDLRQAEAGFVPAAMRGLTRVAGSAQGGTRGWEDVGGLQEVRRALQEILEMPAKHARLFAGAPLRLRSGVLLYGPPGCGKTHVVGAAAAACHLRCIAVKGPELLNKYIGASEQAVRDVFQKASAAAPCILFFDEFDAIAPKRGHDNTGVTDRVVNQLLTELDGVEGLTGVFVLAATSRPDLIDAALLRPGRLDRLLLCDFPSGQERGEILHALARHLPLAEDADWKAVAMQLEGFSGADLQALLAEAQLAAVHAVLDAPGEGRPAQPRVTQELLETVAGKARPSVPPAERARLLNIYESFLSSKSVSASRESKGKRATLA